MCRSAVYGPIARRVPFSIPVALPGSGHVLRRGGDTLVFDWGSTYARHYGTTALMVHGVQVKHRSIPYNTALLGVWNLNTPYNTHSHARTHAVYATLYHYHYYRCNYNKVITILRLHIMYMSLSRATTTALCSVCWLPVRRVYVFERLLPV